MIKRVERFTSYARDGMKPNKTVSYYLFGFILLYQSEYRQVNSIGELDYSNSLKGQKDDGYKSQIQPLSRRIISDNLGQEAV